MAKTRESAKGRKDTAPFVKITKQMISHPRYYGLTGNAVKLLTQLIEQYNGNNNGDIQASWYLFKDMGWKSPTTLNKAVKELVLNGFVVMTQQGGFRNHTPNLYALTWLKIDVVKGFYNPELKKLEGKTLHWWRQSTWDLNAS